MNQQDNVRREPGWAGKDRVLPVITGPRRAASTMGRALALLAILTPIWSCGDSPTAPDTTSLASPVQTLPTAPPTAPTLQNASCVVSSPTTLTAQDTETSGESLTDGINIVFDTFSLTAALSDEPSTDPDRLLFLDVDVSRPAGFALEEGPGAGWTTVSDSFPARDIAYGVSAASGSYTVRVERMGTAGTGDQYDVAITVTVSPTPDGISMVVSALEACPV